MSNEVMLITVNATNNNNKFYHVKYDEASGTLTTRYGRVGNNGVSTTKPSSRREFDSVVRSKKRRGYQETAVLSTTVSTEAANSSELGKVARHYLTGGNSSDQALIKLVDRLVKINKHAIMERSGGQITVSDDGVLKTPLGIVSRDSLTAASKILDDLADFDPKNSKHIKKLEEYLTLVPQKVTGREWSKDFFEKNPMPQQRDFIKELRDSVTWYEDEMKVASKPKDSEDDALEAYKNMFGFTIVSVDENSDEFKGIVKRYEKSKNDQHSASRLKVKRVFRLGVSDPDLDKRLKDTAAALGNVKTLWHGTKSPNILSILRKGLIIPPVRGSSIVTTGRMFGDGIYLSDQSSKSLNYSAGYWGGTQENNCFMFLAEAAMGWEFQPNRKGYSIFTTKALREAHTGSDENGRRYNSISVKGGTCNVRNNEMIVWNPDQVRLTHLIEFDK